MNNSVIAEYNQVAAYILQDVNPGKQKYILSYVATI